MKAALNRVYGSPDVVRVEAVPVPTPGEHEVLIQIKAATVNRTDCGFRSGTPRIVRLFSGLSKPKWPVLGCELAGEIVELGNGVEDFTVGDRVIAYKDDDYGFGCHAQYTVMPITGMIAKAPAHLSFAQCAPALEGAHYALNTIRAANVASGDSVLVNGATGAIGSASVQLLKKMDVQITAVCATEHLDTVKKLGADVVIDYTVEDFTQRDHQFNFVFDAVGKSTYGACKKIMAADASYISTELGPYWQNPIYALMGAVARSRKVLFPIPKNLNSDAHYIAGLLESGAFLPLIDSSYSLEDTSVAYRFVETGMKTGNVVIDIPS